MSEEAHGKHFFPVVMNGGNEAKIVSDVKNDDGAVAFNCHLVCVGKGLSRFDEILPAGSFSHPIPMVERRSCFWIGLLGRIEKFTGNDAHRI